MTLLLHFIFIPTLKIGRDLYYRNLHKICWLISLLFSIENLEIIKECIMYIIYNTVSLPYKLRKNIVNKFPMEKYYIFNVTKIKRLIARYSDLNGC